jgi:hypothetical protein
VGDGGYEFLKENYNNLDGLKRILRSQPDLYCLLKFGALLEKSGWTKGMGNQVVLTDLRNACQQEN